jgi:carbon-monoxide dehydrogenase medium subunit
VKPVQFRYEAPRRLEDALELLAAAGMGGKPLAGGQSLVPMMNFRLARPDVVVDLNRIDALDGIQVGGGGIVIGAMTRHQAVVESAALRDAAPILPWAARHIGHWAIRNRGTVGGSVAHADPAAEWPAVLQALGARAVVASTRGTRSVALDALIVGPLTTTLEPDELIVRIELDRPQPDTRWGFYEVARRPGDFALVGAVVRVDTAGTAVTWFGLSGRPEQRTFPGIREGEALTEALAAATGTLPAVSDIHASDAWRRRVAATVALRAWQAAMNQEAE